MKTISMLVLCLLVTNCSNTTPVNQRKIGKEDREIKAYLSQKISEIDTATTEELASQLNTISCFLEIPKANTQKMTANKIYEKYKESVVIVCGRYLCNNCDKWHVTTSSGFILSKSGACVTSYHVIDNLENERFIVMTPDRKCYGILRIIAADKHNDFAVLQLRGENFPTPIALAEPIVGNDIYVISHPQNRYYSITSGIISRLFIPENRLTNTPYARRL